MLLGLVEVEVPACSRRLFATSRWSNRLTHAMPPYIILRVKYFTDPEGPMLVTAILAGIIAGGVVYWFVDRRFSGVSFLWAVPAIVLVGTFVGWLWRRRSRRPL
jgi:hypothetical protein